MMTNQAEIIDRLLAGVRVMPVVVIDNVAQAVPLADALLEGGIRAIEITLRTDAALDAAEAIATHRPEMIVGTGTVLVPGDLARSLAAGARFAVSPGLTEMLARAAELCVDRLPLLPGVATSSEVMLAMEFGFERLKFFPAEAAGGVAMLKALGGPLAKPKFCPTGGIRPVSAPDYLRLPNVFCIGGTWITPAAQMADGDWASIAALAKDAAQL